MTPAERAITSLIIVGLVLGVLGVALQVIALFMDGSS